MLVYHGGIKSRLSSEEPAASIESWWLRCWRLSVARYDWASTRMPAFLSIEWRCGNESTPATDQPDPRRGPPLDNDLTWRF
jgi:hypothetical protein